MFEEGIARAAAAPAQPVLVSVYLQGGIDAMSVLYPAGDPLYAKYRPALGLPEGAGPAFSEDPACTGTRWRRRWRSSMARARSA